MSIQDESFPYDDLELSRNSGKHMVFPYLRTRSSKSIEENVATKDKDERNAEAKEEESTCGDQDNSTQSSNGCPPESETSRKTNASEPTETESKKTEYVRSTHNKSVSYQDIHSEYTKRRYRHVESKVGQYIANMKALDEKRRSLGKFHRSMPETLSGATAAESIVELHRTPTKGGLLRRSANDLDHMREQDSHSDHEPENYDNLTATTSSSSREMPTDEGIYITKQTYEQLLSAKQGYDYVQSKLEEKNAEYWRLKQSLETMRVEYTLCKDKLKQLNQTHRLSGSFGATTAVSVLGKNSLNCLLYPQEMQEKSTQTESMLTPSPVPPFVNANEMFATPLTPESHSNSYDHAAVGMLAPAALKVHKTVATIQPLSLNFSNLLEQDPNRDCCINNTMGFFRHRSNSMAARKKSTPLAVAVTNTSRASNSSSTVPSGDSAIDIEVLESPKNQRRQARHEEFILLEKRAQRYAVLEARNAGRSYTESEANLSSDATLNAADDYRGRRHRCRKNLRTRIKRFFGACTKCEDNANTSMDTTMGNSQQQSFSQIPLLEKSLRNPGQKLR